MESRSLITEALLPSSESPEVLGGLGDSLSVEAEDDAAQWLIAVGDVEVDLVGDLGALGSFGGLGEEDHAHSEEEQGGEENPPDVEHFWLGGWVGTK